MNGENLDRSSQSCSTDLSPSGTGAGGEAWLAQSYPHRFLDYGILRRTFFLPPSEPSHYSDGAKPLEMKRQRRRGPMAGCRLRFGDQGCYAIDGSDPVDDSRVLLFRLNGVQVVG